MNATNLLQNLKETVEEYDKASLENYQEVYIYDFFAKIRNKVDLHRELIIKEINDKSDQIIEILRQQETECKNNIASLNKICFYNDNNINIKTLKNEKLPTFKTIIDICDALDQREILYLMKEMDSIKESISNTIENYKNSLLMNKKIEFIQNDNFKDLLGELNIDDDCSNILSDNGGKCMKTFTEHSDLVRSVHVNENLNMMISGSEDKSIKVWNLLDDTCIQTIDRAHLGLVTSVLFIDNERFVSGSLDESIKVWDAKNFNCIARLTKGQILSLCLLTNKVLASGTNEGYIHFWDLTSYSFIRSIYLFHRIYSIIQLQNCFAVGLNGRIIIFQNDYSRVKTLLTASKKQIFCLVRNETNEKLISGSEDKIVEIWNIEKGESIMRIMFDASVFDLKLINENVIAIGLDKSTNNLILYDLENKKQIKSLNGHEKMVFKINRLNNGQLITTSADKTIKFWSI